MINKLTEKPVIWLTLEDCEEFYQEFSNLYNQTEPFPPFTSRYAGRLESILGSVQLTHSLTESNLLDVASTYFNKFVRSQCFMNGNKRMGVFFTHIFLLIHGIDYSLTYKELFTFTALIARASEKGITEEETLEWSKRILARFTKEK